MLSQPGDEEMGQRPRGAKGGTSNMWLRAKGKRGHMDAKRPGKVSWGDSFRGRSGGVRGEGIPASSEV